MKFQRNIALALATISTIGLPVSLITANVSAFLIMMVVIIVISLYHARALSKLVSSYSETESEDIARLKKQLNDYNIEINSLNETISKYKETISELEKKSKEDIEQINNECIEDIIIEDAAELPTLDDLETHPENRVIAIDFETANSSRASVCSIGYVVEDDGKIVLEDEILVNPNTDFSNINMRIHGITPEDVVDAPNWSDAWNKVSKYITEDTSIVSHNLKSMELSCIKKECERYNMPIPGFAQNGKNTYDTLNMSNLLLPELESHKLVDLCDYFNIEYDNHHNALADARACLDLFNELKSIGSVDKTDSDATYKKVIPAAFNNAFKNISKENPFACHTFVLTGKFSSGTRDEMIKHLFDIGGVPFTTLTKGTDYLMIGGSKYDLYAPGVKNSSKIKKALEMNENGANIKIIFEDELLSTLKNYHSDEQYELSYMKFDYNKFIESAKTENEKSWYVKNRIFFPSQENFMHFLDFTDVNWTVSENVINIYGSAFEFNIVFNGVLDNVATITNLKTNKSLKPKKLTLDAFIKEFRSKIL